LYFAVTGVNAARNCGDQASEIRGSMPAGRAQRRVEAIAQHVSHWSCRSGWIFRPAVGYCLFPTLRRMIEVNLRGRLGNWLFQYAAGRVLALRHDRPLRLNISGLLGWNDPFGANVIESLRYFDIAATYTRIGAARRLLERLGSGVPQRFDEGAWGYDPAFETLGPRSALSGYFQSPRYWGAFERAIRADLTVRRLPPAPSIHEMLAAIRRCNAVSIHVRRRDYLRKELHNVCTDSYFDRAISHMRLALQSPTFFVFSDDLPWCRERFTGKDFIPVDVAVPSRAAAADIYLMSECRHHIISNSTFSWWGAWMNARPDKIVVTPDRWFNDEAMNALAMRDTVPAEWQRIREP
jgi:Glycosyl transferase family 11